MRNPTRRNRNIGTEDQGFGQNNNLTIATRNTDFKIFHERLEEYKKETRIINDHEFVFVVEKTRKNSIHCCSIDDIVKIIEHIPVKDYGNLKYVVLRQPKRKEEIISPVWGRLSYQYEFENEFYPAIILEAIDLTKKLSWSKKMVIDDQKEFDRLKKDGHPFVETKRAFIANFTKENLRNTQLYRTFLHEFGHYVHYLQTVMLNSDTEQKLDDRETRYFNIPKDEMEKFAHKYADILSEKLRNKKIIPFDPL